MMADAFVVSYPLRDYSVDRAVGPRTIPVLERNGGAYLSGSFPAGVTSVDGVPVSAIVRVQVRDPGGTADGVFVGEVVSGADGTWLVSGLPSSFTYDVIGRKDGFKDVVVSNVTPKV